MRPPESSPWSSEAIYVVSPLSSLSPNSTLTLGDDIEAQSLPEVVADKSQLTALPRPEGDGQYTISTGRDDKEVVPEWNALEVAIEKDDKELVEPVVRDEKEFVDPDSHKSRPRHNKPFSRMSRLRFWSLLAIIVALIVVSSLVGTLAAVMSGRASRAREPEGKGAGDAAATSSSTTSSSTTSSPTPIATSDCPASNGKNYLAENGKKFVWECDVAYSPPYLLISVDPPSNNARQCISKCQSDAECVGVQFNALPTPECVLLSALHGKMPRNGSEVALVVK